MVPHLSDRTMMVKIRRIILLFCCVAVPLVSMAQVGERRNDFSVGFTGGYTMNKMDFQPTIKQAWTS